MGCWCTFCNIEFGSVPNVSILPLVDLHFWFCNVILHCDWLREHQPCFSHSAESSVSFQDGRHFDENPTRQNGFNILNCEHIWKVKYANRCRVFSSKSAVVIDFSFERILKKLLAKKKIGTLSTSTVLHVYRWLFADNFIKLDAGKKFWIHHRFQWNFLHLVDYLNI